MIDSKSSTWMHVSRWAEARVADLHQKLERERDPIVAAEFRGEISALRALLASAAPIEPLKVPEPVYRD